MEAPPDPFRAARRKSGVLPAEFQGETLPMLLRHADVREAARDWQTYSSDAPFRVPIPSEEAVRTVRQLPIETDPPDHTEYRALVEPFFQRARDPAVIAAVEALVAGLLDEALAGDPVEAVRDFALPLQSRALTLLLNVPAAEAETWISWGTHVFKDGAGSAKGAALEAYLNAQFDRAAARPGDDFFSALAHATFRGRPLTRAEMLGFANLTFAGGRDTVIQSVATALAHLARDPASLAYLREDPDRAVLASEEFFRVFMPLTHIGRVCPHATTVQGVAVPPGGRVSLCWASANRDESVFPAPDEIRLDRRPNPHLAFGAGAHLCLGAPHARLLLRTVLRQCAARVATLTLVEAVPHVEREASYTRVSGYARLLLRFTPLPR